MNSEITQTAKNVGLSVLKSKYFWYALLAGIVYFIIKRQITGGTPDLAKLPDEDKSPQNTAQWWSKIGNPVMLELQAALRAEYFPASKRRKQAYLKILLFDKGQTFTLYNNFNASYSTKYYKGKTLTQVIDDQYTLEQSQDDLVARLLGFGLQ